MKVEVRVPMLSDSVASGTLLPWRKQVGEAVARDETLVDLETDKVILEIPAPASGTLLELRLPEGAVVKADEVVAVIETSDVLDTPIPPVQPAPVAASEPPPQPATGVRAALINTPVSAAVSAPSVPFP
ncbi:MAG: biotin/lipoyl-containing protein, partial [Thiobacillus sp.]|nr:biotin/lipoyl-containing protein [Thiobacillus sp.]